MKKILLLMCLLAGVSAVPAQAAGGTQQQLTEVTIALEDLDSTTVSRVLAAKKEAAKKAAKEAGASASVVGEIKEVAAHATPEKVKEWLGAVADFVLELAAALGVSVNEFLNTKAGLGIAALIVWKAGGPYLVNTIVDLCVGAAGVVLSTLIFTWTWQRMFFSMKKHIHYDQSNNKEVIYEPRINWEVRHGKPEDALDARHLAMVLSCIFYAASMLFFVGMMIW